MRLPKEWINHIANSIVENLSEKEFIRFNVSKEESVREVGQMVIEDLIVEDRLDDEVKELLRQYETDIERGKLDYKKLFNLTKQKLVKERNLIL